MALHDEPDKKFVSELLTLIENHQYDDVIQKCETRFNSVFEYPLSVWIVRDYARCMTGDYASTMLHIVNEKRVLSVSGQLRVMAGECCLARGALDGARQWLWHSPWSMNKHVRLMLAATLARLGRHDEVKLVLAGNQDEPATLEPTPSDPMWHWESYLWLCLWQAEVDNQDPISQAFDSMQQIGELIENPRLQVLYEIICLLLNQDRSKSNVALLDAASDDISQELINCLALELLEEFLSIWAEHTGRGCLELARYHRHKGDADAAYRAFNNALAKTSQAKDPRDAHVLHQAKFELVSATLELGHFEAALQVIDTMGLPSPAKAMEAAEFRQEYSTPDEKIAELERQCDHDLWLFKAKAHAGLAQWPQALEAAEIALEGSRNESENEAAAILAAQITLLQCDYRKALTFLEDALRVWADDPTVLLSKAVCEMNLGLGDAARKSLQPFVDQPNLPPDGLFRVGRMFASLGDHVTAEQFYRRSTAILLKGPVVFAPQPEIPLFDAVNELNLPLPISERKYQSTLIGTPLSNADLMLNAGSNPDDLKQWLAQELGDVWEQLSPQSRKTLYTAELQLRNRYNPEFDFTLPMMGLFKVMEIELARGLCAWLVKDHGIVIDEQKFTLDSMLELLATDRVQVVLRMLPEPYQTNAQKIVQFVRECLDNYKMNAANNFEHMMGWAFESLRHSLLKAGWLKVIVNAAPAPGTRA